MKLFKLIPLILSVILAFYANINASKHLQTSKHPSFSVSMTVPFITQAAMPSFSGTSARAACLIDAKSGAVLYSHNENSPLPMASTTKIMTALVILENMSPETVVAVPKEVQYIEGSSIYLAPGEKITVETLLYGLMLESGNDAAYTLAVSCSKSIEDFCTLMNKKADELGLINTHFENPHGLHNDNHYTTAYELCVIASKALENELFRKIVSTKSTYAKSTFSDETRYFSNHNKLLRTFPNTIGVKTGFTKKAGRCLVSAVQKNEERFVAVTLNDGNDWHDHASMLSFAFENFDTLEICNKDDFYIYNANGQKYVLEESVFLTVPKGDKKNLDYKISFFEKDAGIEYLFDGKICGKVGLKKAQT